MEFSCDLYNTTETCRKAKEIIWKTTEEQQEKERCGQHIRYTFLSFLGKNRTYGSSLELKTDFSLA
jgi:hypothetical protein